MTRAWGRVVSLAVALTATACHPPTAAKPVPPSPFPTLAYNESPVSARAQVVLVAGGDDIANFAAEVVDQRALWLRAGLEPDQIECYYAKPSAQAWAEDHEQYAALAPALATCHRADPARVRRDLITIATANPSFVYLYITAHGVPSQLRGKARGVRGLRPSERAFFEQPALGLDAGPAPPLGDRRKQLRALRRGENPADLLATPRWLVDALASFDPSTVKFVVLQACYSGSFIGHHVGTQNDAETTLRSSPNVVAMTATAAERPSFGCGPGRARTYFGGAFLASLREAIGQSGASPPALDWQRLFEQTAFAVGAMELVSGSRASVPGFLDTRSP